MEKRSSGILLPIFSLPDEYGIGTLGKKAYQFVDFLKDAKQTYWQVLPIGQTSYGDSPYQSFSSFAGNPYFIDLELLVEEGLLTYEEIASQKDDSPYIDYANLYFTRFKVLRKAFTRFNQNLLIDFEKENPWVNDYALFMSIKDLHLGASFLDWEKEYKYKDPEEMEKFSDKHAEDIKFYKFLQYEFFKQWMNLKTYANSKGIYIIGDLPIYVALDSADVWCNKKEFQLDEHFNPTYVAGCPPDAFTPLGQLWGNPLYNYDYMKKDHFSWWVNRIKINSKLFDVIRIDHFRGFEAYYAIPYGDENAKRGVWKKGPNTKLFEEVNKQLGHIDIIAENLGFLTKEVDIMMEKLGYPGMKVLQFGFDPSGTSDAIPHNLRENMLVYTGTHDNMTTRQWYDTLDPNVKTFFKDYMHFESDYEAVNVLIRAALSSPCKLSVIPMMDYLQKGAEARINEPSTIGENWTWKMDSNDMNHDLAAYIAHLMYLYHR